MTSAALDDFEWSEADYWLLRMLPESLKAGPGRCNAPARNEIDPNHCACLHANRIGDGDAKKQKGGR